MSGALHVRMQEVKSGNRLKCAAIVLASLCAFAPPAAHADQAAENIPTDAESASSVTKKDMLHGSAEIHTDAAGAALQGSQLYKQGADALNRQNYRAAADLFHRSAACFEQSGEDKFQAQALFAEAQSNRLMGHVQDAGKLY